MASKFVVYLRVSTVRQGASGLGLEAQREAVEKYALAVGGVILDSHVEIESGRVRERPVLSIAIARCRQSGATLLIAKLDRLSRSVHFITGMMESKVPFLGQRAVRFPGSASAAELIFYCPVCQNVIDRGFGAACDCGQGALKFAVHRSGTVFKPRGISLINPPKREILVQIDQVGGGERALDWVLSGMAGRRLTDSAPTQSAKSIRRLLQQRGFDPATIEAMVAAMPTGPVTELPDAPLPLAIRGEAERQAKQIALATFESRTTIQDLLARAQGPTIQYLYEATIPASLTLAGLERVELIDKFPVLTAQFGYTRGPSAAGEGQLRTYREQNGDFAVYGELAQTEALLLRLDPMRVHRWLVGRGLALGPAMDGRSAATAIISAMGPPEASNEMTVRVTELVHSYSHAFIKRAAVFAGIERSALSEVVLPTALSFFVYAAARGDFVLGGLQALFESELNHLLDGLVADEHRCALDPGCEDTGAACAVCLHLGEPSCRMFNTALSRKALAGGAGYTNGIRV